VAVGEEVELWVSQVKNEENLRHSSLVLSSDSEKVFSPSPEKLKAGELKMEIPSCHAYVAVLGEMFSIFTQSLQL